MRQFSVFKILNQYFNILQYLFIYNGNLTHLDIDLDSTYNVINVDPAMTI